MGQGLSLQLRWFLTSPNAKIWILELCYQSILLIGSINAEPDIPAANTIEIEEEQQLKMEIVAERNVCIPQSPPSAHINYIHILYLWLYQVFSIFWGATGNVIFGTR